MPDWGTTFRGVVDGWLFPDVDGPLPPAAVLPLENPDLHDRSDWAKRVEAVRGYRSVSVARHRGHEFAVLTAKLGAPAAAMAVQAAAARGVRTLIGVGCCGAVADTLTCGELLVPSGAVAAAISGRTGSSMVCLTAIRLEIGRTPMISA